MILQTAPSPPKAEVLGSKRGTHHRRSGENVIFPARFPNGRGDLPQYLVAGYVAIMSLKYLKLLTSIMITLNGSPDSTEFSKVCFSLSWALR